MKQTRPKGAAVKLFHTVGPGQVEGDPIIYVAPLSLRVIRYGFRDTMTWRRRAKSKGLNCWADIEVPDRETGHVRVITFYGVGPETRGPKSEARALRNLLRFVAAHEIEESIYVGGVRVFDPHAGGRRTTSNSKPVRPPRR